MNPLANSSLCNPALPDRLGGCQTGGDAATSGLILARLIATLWRTILTVGGLAVIIFLIWGGIAWLTAGGDKTRVEAARNRITNALVGLAIIFAAIAIISLIQTAFGINILSPEFQNNSSQPTTPTNQPFLSI